MQGVYTDAIVEALIHEALHNAPAAMPHQVGPDRETAYKRSEKPKQRQAYEEFAPGSGESSAESRPSRHTCNVPKQVRSKW